MLQVSRTACVCSATNEDINGMRSTFQRDHAIRLPRFFDADLVETIQHHLRGAAFSDRDDGIAREACMSENALLAMLHLITNDEQLFDAVTAITGCGAIGMFLGRIYRMRATDGHSDRWHSDASDNRLIGLSVNLTDRQFTGGVFELRDTCAKFPTWSVANTGLGDAILFEISDRLQHRVTDVAGATARVAYAGWFHSEPRFLTLLKETAS
jgi:hypothetical protein